MLLCVFFRHNCTGTKRTLRSLQQLQRCYSTEAQTQEKPLPLPNSREKSYSPKIQQIVQDISHLTLLEVSDLNELLKVCIKTCECQLYALF